MLKHKYLRCVVGITGTIGSGKSTVARLFASLGAKVIDADRIAHSLIRPGARCYQKVVASFGKGALKRNGAIDRGKLGKVVFDSSTKLRTLSRIMHPVIIQHIKRRLKGMRYGLIVLDAPLLLEAGQREIVDYLVVVKASRSVLLRRLLKKTGLGRAELIKRIKQQIPLYAKVRIADFVIDNSKTFANTRKQVKMIRRKLWKS